MKRNGAIVIEGHVQGLSNCRSLGELGVPVYILDVVHCLAQHSKYCTKHFVCPPFQSKEFIDFLVELAEKENLNGWFLVCSNDHIVENLSLNRGRLEKYYKFLVPEKEDLYNIINKKKLLEVASKCGTTIPKTCYYDTVNEATNFRFPLLVKGNLGLSFYKATHSKAIQVDDFCTLKELLSSLSASKSVDLDDVMIQELIPFDEKNKVVSFTCFAVNGEIKTYWMGQKLREHPIKYGTATCSQSVLICDIVAEATPLVKALNYTGTCEIEFMRDPRDGKWNLIEINPRTWLWVGLAKECGVDYAKIMYKYVNGIEQEYPYKYKVGIKWRNSITDFVFSMKGIFKGLFTLSDYFKSLKGEKMHAIWSWNDIKPGLIFPFMIFYIANKRR